MLDRIQLVFLEIPKSDFGIRCIPLSQFARTSGVSMIANIQVWHGSSLSFLQKPLDQQNQSFPTSLTPWLLRWWQTPKLRLRAQPKGHLRQDLGNIDVKQLFISHVPLPDLHIKVLGQ